MSRPIFNGEPQFLSRWLLRKPLYIQKSMGYLSFLFFLLTVIFHPLAADAPEQRVPDALLEIPMRDEVKLPANLYLPKGCDSGQKVPCVLVRHPLGKEVVDPSWFELVDAGYALVVQSTRSCCDESGKSVPYITDGWSLSGTQPVDGYDTVQWLAQQGFSNGKIATIGVSATGITQFLLAPSAPPNLVCQHIEMAAPSMYQYAVYPGGQFRKEQVEGWLKVHRRAPSVIDWLRQKSRYDAFWSRFNSIDFADLVRVPQVHIGGWFDIFLQGTIDGFIAAKEHSQAEVRKVHRLIIGPWGHRWRKSNKVGNFELTQKMKTAPYNITQLGWLDYHLKGIQNDASKAPPVQYYVMGSFDGSESYGNVWRAADTWPPAGTQYIPYSFGNDGKLVVEAQGSNPITTSYQVLYDQKNPVPTIGGRNLFMPDGPLDLASLIARDDVVLLKSEQLKQETEVTGRIYANVYVSGVEEERDLCLRLVDIAPNGEHYIISEGVSHMEPQRKAEDGLANGLASSPRLVVVDLWSTSMVFGKGHSIGLLITASNYPAYDLSPSKKEGKGLGFTIQNDRNAPSCLMLPIMQQQ